jgi:hypothetical protein
MMRYGIGHTLLHFLSRWNSDQGNRKCIRSRAAEMHVRIVETGHHKLAV